MSADYRQLTDFAKKMEVLSEKQKDEFLDSCCKELAARLLAKVVKRTPVSTGYLRRGWTGGDNGSAARYAQSLEVRHIGNTCQIEIVNPIEYASYVEYGHRSANHKGWVEGKHMLTISEQEIQDSSQAILMRKLNQFMRKVFK